MPQQAHARQPATPSDEILRSAQEDTRSDFCNALQEALSFRFLNTI